MDVREKLVRILEEPCGGLYPACELADYLISNGITVRENVEIIDELLKQLKNAPITICKEEPSIELVQDWISVDDRLPDPDQDVILYTREIETYGKHHEKKKIYRNIYMGYFDGEEWLTSYCHGCEYIFRMNEKYPNETIEVTHWMPLPHPPKGE